MLELHTVESHCGDYPGHGPGDSTEDSQASCCIMKNAHFFLGIKESSFILEVDISVSFTLEEKSFEILIFSRRKIVIVLVLDDKRNKSSAKISWTLLKHLYTCNCVCEKVTWIFF